MEETAVTKANVIWTLDAEEIAELRQLKMEGKGEVTLSKDLYGHYWTLCFASTLPEEGNNGSQDQRPAFMVYLSANQVGPEDWNRATSDLAWSRGEASALFEFISPIKPRQVVASCKMKNWHFNSDQKLWSRTKRISGMGLDELLDYYDKNGEIALSCTVTWSRSASVHTVLSKVPLSHFDNRDVGDVVFRFPQEVINKSPIFASKLLLTLRSDYFKTLFEGGFSETSEANSMDVSDIKPKAGRYFTVDNSELAPFYLETMETSQEKQVEAANLQESNPAAEVSSSRTEQVKIDEIASSSSRRVHVIDITQTDYTTYRSLLAFLYCGHVLFTALPSEYLVARDKALAEHLPTDPSFAFEIPEKWFPEKYLALRDQYNSSKMIPCFPPSMYRLADCYDIEELKSLTKDRILRSLTVETVAYELFSPLSIEYEEIQKPVLAFFVENWKEVKKTTAFKNILDKIAAGELAQARELIEKVWTMMSSRA
ncbi:BTB/POZ domain-containing protein [Sporobolomyces salmoneus]|uniref:BTB/POZ domain-containing protein n=1 Tax=Sporobolomyces salmoneus TaxID=183962 RepID=UPI0031779B99